MTGVLVQPRDPRAMADAVLALLREPARRQRIRAAGLELAQRFSWKCVHPILAAQYRRALDPHRRSLYSTLVAGLLFPLHERFKRHDSIALRRRMEQSQWWQPAQLAIFSCSACAS